MVKAKFVEGLSWLHAKVGRQIPFIRPTNSHPKLSPIPARPPAHLGLTPEFSLGLPKA